MGAPKYVLLSHDRQAEFEGEEGHEETWAWCEDAEDLFSHLEETRLLADRPCARDLTPRNVTIEGTAPDRNPFAYPSRPSLSHGYRLLGPHGQPHGTCRDLA
ncbi:hypothetical protein ACFYZ2_34760 [Streptomyces sviceus]|uniref:hypothetical protein n=1 Tax=Streptomyces sviceus TaxID=285530 RepID=UPI0036AA62BA